MTLPSIGKPATNALNQLGIFHLEQLADLDEKNLSKIHGIGPKAVKILKEAMTEKALKFKDTEPLPFVPPFAVLGDLSCNNAPKREIIRDFVIALHIGHPKKVDAYITDDCELDSSITDKKISALNLLTIISHGKDGAAEGIIYLNSGQTISFAYFFKFENHKKTALIKEVTRYLKN